MSRKFFSHSFVACALAFGLSGAAYAQSTTSDEAHKTKEATKDAAHDTADAAKHAGKTVTKATKKAARATKDAVTPDTTSALCKDGTVQTGKTKATACDDHGGVKKQ
jgi:hypothetical protein